MDPDIGGRPVRFLADQLSVSGAAPDEGLLVTNRFGSPVQRSDLNQRWHRALRIAGLPERTRFHDPKTVQALSRHAEFSESWDTYAHPPTAVGGVNVTAVIHSGVAPGAGARPAHPL
ncbi:hypothetical protein [Streptomyces profundus]|uniref:hypothetical protein n=1 Tax=Streptomyces profundus TaxID=2867410 RepID=UPI001D1664FF|nr:hypothetical protein [Streptomyces sp. MA3_2.13]